MNYDAMKELSNKLAAEVNNPQAPEENQHENASDETNREYSVSGKLTSVESSDSWVKEQTDLQQDRVTDLLGQQQEILNRLLSEVIAQTAQLTALELRLNGLPDADKHTSDSMHEQLVQNLISEVAGLKDAVLKQEKANTDILRDSKNFQAGVKARMQDELDQYHKLHAQNVYAPILTEIAGLYINTERLLDSTEDSHLKDQLKNALLDSLAELLEENGVTITRTEIGQPRSLRLCKTRKTIATGDESLKGKVAKSYNPSFVLGNQILQKEIVDTYIFDTSLASIDEDIETSAQSADAADNRTANYDVVIPETTMEQVELPEETVE